MECKNFALESLLNNIKSEPDEKIEELSGISVKVKQNYVGNYSENSEDKEKILKMSPSSFFDSGFLEESKPQWAEPNYNNISSKNDISFSKDPLPYFSYFQNRKFFHNDFKRPFRKFQTSQKPCFSSDSKPPRPYFPLPFYFGKRRDDQSVYNPKSKFQKNSTDNFPPLMSNLIHEGPGPSQTTTNNERPFDEQIYSVNHGKRPFPKSGLEMAIRHASPDCKLSKDEGKFIQMKLVEEIDNSPKSNPLPHFLKAFYDQGVVWMVCADELSKEWLILNVQKLNSVWENLNLIVEAVKLPKRPIVYVDLPELDSGVEILDRLATQNENLHTENWVVLNRQVFNTRQRVTFSIDVDSFEYLKSNGLRAVWKLQSVTFKVPGKTNKSRFWKAKKEKKELNY